MVPDDKFDKHFKKARLDDIESRKAIFTSQTESSEQTRAERLNLKSSVY